MSRVRPGTGKRHARRRSRVWLALAAVCAVLLLGDLAYWTYVCRQLESGFAVWQAQARAEGWSVRSGPTHLGGWPIAASLTVSDMTLTGGDADIPGGVSWGAQQLELLVPLWRPQELVLRAGGAQHLRLGNAPDLPYTSRRMQAVLPLMPDTTAPTAVLLGEDVRMTLPPGVGRGGQLTIGTLRADLDLHPDSPKGQAALALAVEASAIALPPADRWALGPEIASLRLDAALDGPLSSAPELAARAAAWRDGGGALQLRQVALRWGPLTLSGTASLGLDQQLQPQGTGSAHIVGYGATLDALVASGVMPQSAALAAKAVLSLMAHTPQGGGPAEVDVPLNLHQGTLSMQQVPLLRIPSLDWRGGRE